jgi:amidase
VSVPGFQTRTVRDLAACMDFASGSLPGDPMAPPDPAQSYVSEVGRSPGELRIGVWNRLPATFDGVLHPECQQAVDDAGKLLESLGHVVELAHPPVLDDPKTPSIFNRIWPVRLLSVLQFFERKLEKRAGPDNLDPDTLYWLDRARGVSATEYLLALEDMDAFTRAFAGWWQSYDVLLSPVTGTVTPKLGALGTDAARMKTFALWWPFTAFYNMAGQPAISLPLHWSADGMPVGVQLGAAYGHEDVLIRLGAQLEQARPWAQRIPPVHA